jgi:hypothetical protein
MDVRCLNGTEDGLSAVKAIAAWHNLTHASSTGQGVLGHSHLLSPLAFAAA